MFHIKALLTEFDVFSLIQMFVFSSLLSGSLQWCSVNCNEGIAKLNKSLGHKYKSNDLLRSLHPLLELGNESLCEWESKYSCSLSHHLGLLSQLSWQESSRPWSWHYLNLTWIQSCLPIAMATGSPCSAVLTAALVQALGELHQWNCSGRLLCMSGWMLLSSSILGQCQIKVEM